MKNKIQYWIWMLCFTMGNLGVAAGGDPDSFFAPRPEFYRAVAEPPSRNLFVQIGGDFKNLFSTRDNLVIIGAGVGAALGARPVDGRVASSGFNSELNGGTALDSFFEAGESIGDGYVHFGGALAAYGLGKLVSKPGLADLGRDLVRAQIVTGAVTTGIKVIASRERPDGSTRTSFPSGHTSSTFATATVIQRRYGWKAGIPAYAVASYVAASRLNESKHFLSDVLFGAALGIIGARTVTVDIAANRFALGPLVTRDGVGVQLDYRGASPSTP